MNDKTEQIYWTDVRDYLPEYGTKVLVCGYPRIPIMEGTAIAISKRMNIENTMLAKDRRYIENARDNNSFEPSITVTHWMPLPDKPLIKPVI